MFNISTIKTNLYGLIGLRDTVDPDYPLCTLTGATESVYFDDYHPLITFDQLNHIAPNFDSMNYTKWVSTGYSTSSYVMYDNVAYCATRTMLTGDTPSKTSTARTAPVNAWIQNKQYASINKLCNQLFTNKKMNESAKTFLDSVQVVDGAGRIEDTITAGSGFVGFEIDLKRINNIKAVINHIGLQFTATQGSLTVYLFHSSQKAAVGTWTFTTTVSSSFDWQSATSPATGDNELHYVNYTNNINSGGRFYIGYFEADISGSAIVKNACDGVRYKWSKWATIRPITVASGDLDGTNIFDIDKIGYTDTNYGLNLSFSIKTDLTEMMVDRKELFVNALGYQFANDMIQGMVFNSDSRINKMQDTATRNSVIHEWSAPENPNSIKRRLDESIDSLSFDLSEISQGLAGNGPRIHIGAI